MSNEVVFEGLGLNFVNLSNSFFFGIDKLSLEHEFSFIKLLDWCYSSLFVNGDL